MQDLVQLLLRVGVGRLVITLILAVLGASFLLSSFSTAFGVLQLGGQELTVALFSTQKCRTWR